MSPLVSIRDLTVRFAGAKTVNAVNGVSLDIAQGEVLGLLGESGSGKSVTLRALMRLHPEKRTTYGGSVQVDGQDVLGLSAPALEAYRGKTCGMIFQDPILAFDPVYSLGRQISEAIRRHEAVDEATATARAIQLLERVQVPSAKRRYDAYPHEVSGGMRQRAMIALALACKPKLLLADEPTTALDATVQIQVLLLLRELQQELGMSVIFVTHDIGVAAEISDRIAVMYGGRIVEQGPLADIMTDPRHPYTRGLMASTVRPGMRGQRLEAIPGMPPDLTAMPPGCAFAPRCAQANAACTQAVPPLLTLGDRQNACIHAEAPCAAA